MKTCSFISPRRSTRTVYKPFGRRSATRPCPSPRNLPCPSNTLTKAVGSSLSVHGSWAIILKLERDIGALHFRTIMDRHLFCRTSVFQNIQFRSQVNPPRTTRWRPLSDNIGHCIDQLYWSLPPGIEVNLHIGLIANSCCCRIKIRHRLAKNYIARRL